MKLKKYIFVAIVLVVSVAFLGGCQSTPIDTEARDLLDKYNLHPISSPTERKAKLNKFTFELINSASKDIGFDLLAYQENELKTLSYLLNERSQGREGKIFANFIYRDKKIVGAFLTLSDYMPGIGSLKDRSSFAPGKLAPDNLVFEEVYKIELLGPWNQHDWENKAELKEPQEIDSFISRFRQSVQRRGYSSPTIDDEEYVIIFYYSDGPIIRARLYTNSKTRKTIMRMDPDIFSKWHYIPPEELKTYISKNLGLVSG